MNKEKRGGEGRGEAARERGRKRTGERERRDAVGMEHTAD